MDDTSCLFDLSDTTFLAHMCATYLQAQIAWQFPPLKKKLLSCVIFKLPMKLCKREIHKMLGSRGCADSGETSAPPCRLALLSKINPSLELISCRYTDTGFDMPTTPNGAWLWEISETHVLDGLSNPRKPPEAQVHTGLDRRLTRQLKTYSIKDPPLKQEKAAPLGIIHSIVAAAAITSNPKTCQVTNLVQLGFHLCLRLCKYTK